MCQLGHRFHRRRFSKPGYQLSSQPSPPHLVKQLAEMAQRERFLEWRRTGKTTSEQGAGSSAALNFLHPWIRCGTAGLYIVINDDVKHVFDLHGDAAAEIKGNNIPLEQWMFDALPDVVTSPDTIEHGKIGKGKKNAGKQSVIFKKAFPGGTVVTVQFDNKGRGTMEINTLYAKENEDTSSKLDTAAGAAPSSTSETLEPVSSFNFTIPQGAEPVNLGEGVRPGTQNGMTGATDG
ncbi:hypothetical protein [Dysosmobacter sp.]|uniref:PBECR3 domain-containing polyvalent protein n=1 Tax=Dysosmobacter sp. TaxID=2591382 RepID=UPI003D8B1916